MPGPGAGRRSRWRGGSRPARRPLLRGSPGRDDPQVAGRGRGQPLPGRPARVQTASGRELTAVAKVLVVDDDSALLRALHLGLRARGHEVITAVNGEQGLSQTALTSPDVVVLDLGLPDIDGLTVCERIRHWSDVPIVVLSAIGSEDRKVAALDGGADDYVTKPFGMAELEARIRTAIRHRGAEAPEETPPAHLSVGSLDVDLVHHEVHMEGRKVDLTPKEFEVLSYLARHAGKTCTRQMILLAVWGEGYDAEAQYLHAYVHRLRQKLNDPSGILIRTAPGIGYTLAVDPTWLPNRTRSI
jgi:two-component system, OmpR family, KDP operon response regulator KdpE